MKKRQLIAAVFASIALSGTAVSAKGYWGTDQSYGEKFVPQCESFVEAGFAYNNNQSLRSGRSKAELCESLAATYQKNQNIKGWIGLVTGGPYGAFIAPWWYEFVNRNDIAWTISGLVLGGPCWYALVLTCGVAVAGLKGLNEWDNHPNGEQPDTND